MVAWPKLAACALLAQLGLSRAESTASCAASPGNEAACVAETLLQLASQSTEAEGDLASALQLGRKAGLQKIAADAESAGGAGGGQPWKCPFLPKHQPLEDPVTVRACDGPITLELTSMEVCDVSGDFKDGKLPGTVTTWYTRAYALPGKAPTIPGPTILVKPGDNLTITIVNKLTFPNPDCDQTRPAQETGNHAYINTTVNPDQATGYCYVNATNLHVHGMHVNPKKGGDNIFEHWPPGTTHTLSVMVPPNHATGAYWYHPHRHHSTANQAGGGQHGAIIIEDPPGLLPREIEDLPTRVVVLSLVDVQNVTSVTGATSPVIEEQSLGNLWKDPKGNYVSRINTTYMLTNGMWKPSWFTDNREWTRFDFVYATVEYNIIIQALPTDNVSAINGFSCEFQLLAKDGAYLNYAPRRVDKIYMASGNRASFAMRCGCKKFWVGPCTGSLFSYRELDSPVNGGASPVTMEDIIDGNPTGSTTGPFAGVGQATINQEFLFVVVAPNPFKPKCDDLPYFEVERPCYLVNLTGVDVEPENNGTLSLPAPTGPTDPQWQIVYWSNVTTPADYSGTPFEDDVPPLQNWTLGAVHELWFRNTTDSTLPRAYQIAGISQHPIHLHVTQYQLVALRCQNLTWIQHGACEDDPYFQVGDWHDTLMFGGGEARVRFQLSTFNGPWVLHCHILSHEDQGMMAWFNVSGEEGTVWPGAPDVQTCYKGYFGQS